MKEVFRDIPDYEGLYQVSNLGNVKSFPRKGTTAEEKILKQYKNRYGYSYVCLYKNNKPKKHTIHQLVAMTFINNSNNLSQVNHINGDKADNKVDNLEWCTASENKLHSYNILKAEHYKRKIICVETGMVYESILEASKKCNCSRIHIIDCCKGRRNITGGYHWKYKD